MILGVKGDEEMRAMWRPFFFFNFRCYTVHVVELLNYYTNHCTYIKFYNFYTCTVVGVIIE